MVKAKQNFWLTQHFFFGWGLCGHWPREDTWTLGLPLRSLYYCSECFVTGACVHSWPAVSWVPGGLRLLSHLILTHTKDGKCRCPFYRRSWEKLMGFSKIVQLLTSPAGNQTLGVWHQGSLSEQIMFSVLINFLQHWPLWKSKPPKSFECFLLFRLILSKSEPWKADL